MVFPTTVRCSTTRGFPHAFLVGSLCRRNAIYAGKANGSSRVCLFKRVPIPRNVLLPRKKGFVSSVSQMRLFVPAIYDSTVSVPNNQPPPTLLRIFQGNLLW
ncbi:PREDICTED: 1-acyl-sn-glycerol-3-phosphate [Prunus dulcis]|uniref:PREDICTED: 1-acyl-sn-glycerol-3-phosphate n=1 Tax=Prunus dulcis TaxID=3755 RepID=A0A5E4GIC9_PRUDU|nr:hypothetical protein L3X38_027986 [Prunus dulcis]VVA39460.1 PREDICTED: 1-acyl-sn-glycerol-3-phosphate [Prunus dulcis]